MVRARSSRTRLHVTIAATAAVGLVAGVSTVSTVSTAAGAPAPGKLAHSITTTSKLSAAAIAATRGSKPARLPAGVPAKGTFAFLLKLNAQSTSSVYSRTKRVDGTRSARAAARSQLGTVTAAQNRAIRSLPRDTRVLYRTHAAMAGVAVVTNVKNYDALTRIGDVAAVYPLAPKKLDNSYAVPLQGGAAAWDAYGDHGENATVAIIDTGVDYTHANLGGPGTVSAYDTAKANDDQPVDPGSYDHAKFDATSVDAHGNPLYMYDFAGDAYDASSSDPAEATPSPDPNPLDCNSHGSHVAGTVAGYGENADGTTYTGTYDASTPFDTLRIGPGMAPKARIYAYKIFGCADLATTNITGEAIDKAMDPNGDGDTSDHADVVNMSLGSDYSFPDDGDSILTNEASQIAGVTMVVASGNGGDVYDIGGSPGNAVRTIAVANSQDAYSQDDTLTVSAPGSIAGDYAAERSIAWDWQHKADLSGDVVQLTEPDNPEACKPISAPYAAQLAGKIAFVEWTDDDTRRPCGSAARSANLVAAGASGFIFGSDGETFSAGITGSSSIPGVLVAKTGADAIRAELVAGHTVTISGTQASNFAQLIPGLDDTLNTSSSRGIRDAGNVKPDVTAVGTSVFSTGMGTGNEGLSDSGTSMATPMVAGTAALVISKHPDWTPEQVKADIMNTADADLYTGQNDTGDTYGPNRVGAGRIDVKSALDNQVLAYTVDGPGGTTTGNVSASFGSFALLTTSGISVRTKTIRLQNTGGTAVTYATSFDSRTAIPGATYSVSPASVTVQPQQTATVTLTLTVDPSKLTKTIDPTVSRLTDGNPRQYLADASGLVMFTPSDNSLPDLRVPAYAAPRPASDMTQPSSVKLPSGTVAKALLPLSGHAVDQGSGETAVQSIVAGFELQATSPQAPKCSATVIDRCWTYPSERGADLRYVGSTSDAPQLSAIGQNPLTDGLAYFAISGWSWFRNPVGAFEHVVWIDGNGDHKVDAELVTARVRPATLDTDVMITELFDLTKADTPLVDVEVLNASLGDTDTAIFDSDTIVLPVAIGAIPGVTSRHSRINYVVETYDGYQDGPIDSIGNVDHNGRLLGALSMDVLHPGVTVTGTYTGHGSPLLFEDSPGAVLALRRDAASYAADRGQGALLVHFHNLLGHKAQRVSLTRAAVTPKLALSSSRVTHGHPVKVTVTVSGSAGAATGSVTVRRVDRGHAAVLRTLTLSGGKATFTYTPRYRGSYLLRADYGGDPNYLGGRSATVSLRVT